MTPRLNYSRLAAEIVERQPLVLVRERLLGVVCDATTAERVLPRTTDELEKLAERLEKQTGTRMHTRHDGAVPWGEIQIVLRDTSIQLLMAKANSQSLYYVTIGRVVDDDEEGLLI